MDYDPTFLVRPVVPDLTPDAQGRVALRSASNERQRQDHVRLSIGMVWRIRWVQARSLEATQPGPTKSPRVIAAESRWRASSSGEERLQRVTRAVEGCRPGDPVCQTTRGRNTAGCAI